MILLIKSNDFMIVFGIYFEKEELYKIIYISKITTNTKFTN